MALGRSRSKRSSSTSSYASTITTVAFIAVCVIGVWMLTSNSVVPPQTTARKAELAAISAAVDEPEVTTSNDVQNNEPSNKKDQPVFEDNPGDLPADAIKSDDPKTINEQRNNGKQDSGDQGSAVEENSQGLKGKESGEEQEKQRENHTQVSEESSLTQNQQADQRNQEISQSDQGNQKTRNEESNENQEQTTASENGQNSHEQFPNQKQNEHQQREQHEKIDVGKHSHDSQNQELNGDQQPQKRENNKKSQNSKSYDDQQQQQRQEDAGIQTTSRESQDEISEEDQKERLKQQRQRQQQEDSASSDEAQQKQHQFGDVTIPGIKQNEDKKSEKATEGVKIQAKNQQTHKESQGENNRITKTKHDTRTEDKSIETNSFPGGGTSGIPKESKESKRSWSTQATESENQKGRRKEGSDGKESLYGYSWALCNDRTGPDFIPCLDNEKAVKKLKTTRHFEHRERHCPEEGPTCLVPLPKGYKRPITWPGSRDKV